MARARRVLWLLNHRTLMRFEVPMLERLGFEVFVPKHLTRNKSIRSGGVDSGYDRTLSIPPHDLAELNAFNFWDDPWPPHIRSLTNRHFAFCFCIVWPPTLGEVVEYFRGQILLRAFGHPQPLRYWSLISEALGPRVQELGCAAGREGRFWFAQGYPFVAENEVVLDQRPLYLPIGLPADCAAQRGTWQGDDNRILAVIPDINASPIYRATYERFKSTIGSLPHVIAGIQHAAVDDPHVVGFVPQEMLDRLMRSCVVLFDPMREPRHLHYHAVEALNVGMPVVFFDGSLLGRLSPQVTCGRVRTPAEAHTMLQRLVGGDRACADEMREGQTELLTPFLDPYCERRWRENLLQLQVIPEAVSWRQRLAVALKRPARLIQSS